MSDEPGRAGRVVGIGLEQDTVAIAGPSERALGDDQLDWMVPHGYPAMLAVVRGPEMGARFAIARDVVTVVGRQPDCAVPLSNVTVSRRHAEIRCDDAGRFVLTDLGSLNGTYLNARPVDTAVLADRDELTIGVFRLIFRTRPQ